MGSTRLSRLTVLYASTIFLSAFLLFQLQPLMSRFILPWFGGSPAVWTTCLLFFQTVLFAGYAYAHWSEHFLRPRARTIVHLTLIGAALLHLAHHSVRLVETRGQRLSDQPHPDAAGRLHRSAVLRSVVDRAVGPSLVQLRLCGPVPLPTLLALELRLAVGTAQLSLCRRAGPERKLRRARGGPPASCSLRCSAAAPAC